MSAGAVRFTRVVAKQVGVAGFVKEMAPGAADFDVDTAGRVFIKTHRPTSLLGRLAGVDAVANMVAYLCSS